MQKIRKKQHNEWGEPLYVKWASMKARCRHSKYYVGVDYDKRWETYECFRDDMRDSFIEHVFKYGLRQTTLDRIDSKKDYSKENCRWTTPKEQSYNRRQTIFVTYNNRKIPLSLFSEITRIQYTTVMSRYKKYGDNQKLLTKRQRKRRQ